MKRSPEDQPLPAELRAELLRSRHAAQDYDVVGKLPQLRAALERAQLSVDIEAAEHGAGTALERLAQLAGSSWKIVFVASAIGTAAWLVWPAPPASAPPAPVQPSEPQAEPTPTTPALAIGDPDRTTATPQPREVLPDPSVARPPPANPEAREQPPPEALTSPTPESPRASAASSRREIDQLLRIRALLEHDPAAAFRLAQRSEREFPQGVLSEERQALQVLALVKSGAARAAERKAREFFARYPQSPMRERLAAALGR